MAANKPKAQSKTDQMPKDKPMANESQENIVTNAANMLIGIGSVVIMALIIIWMIKLLG
ncbi:MAG TPA: hypothetical protein PK511_12265 [Chitinophagales bacterium]|nr:hypothetical protein [Chitinophagales bacterium]HMU69059.1 hypothetical protein [Chitinophagales bacterium]HMZ88529.1 hypothetical protein [Chitinophagales bacterium]HNE45817.1 hypothetical protein [Chitinophagales bacterium]HNF69915.1 hypothetical protein [Chitinophagales bacterium]